MLMVKLISKSETSNRLHNVMFNLVSENQGAYVNSRFISEGEGLTLDNLEIIDSLPIDGLFMTIDIEKVFKLCQSFFLNICSKMIPF